MSVSRRAVERFDLVRIRWPMEPAFRHDGGRIAYVVSGPDNDDDRMRYRLHVLDRTSGTTVAVDTTDDVRSPQWSPSEGRLACLVAAVVGLVAESGELAPLVDSPRRVRMFAWAPDGDELVVVADGPPPEDLPSIKEVTSVDDLRHVVADEVFLLPAAGGESRRLQIDGMARIEHIAWSPDGSSIAFSGRRLGGGSPASVLAIFSLDVATGSLAEIVPPDGPVQALAWSPAGDLIAYLGHGSAGSGAANVELRVVPADGSAPSRSLSATLDRSIGQVVRGDDQRGMGPADLFWDDEGILVACASGGSSAILRFGLDGAHHKVVSGHRAVLGFDVATATGELAFVWSDAETPGELSVSARDGSDERQCSDVNSEWQAGVEILATELVQVVTSDRATVEGWLTTPSAFSGSPHHPLVLQVHGGPHYPVGNRFSFDAQRLAGRGIAMLRANPRGSQGYGVDFASGIQGGWGGRDFADLRELLDEVAERSEIDAARIAIVGESYGGFMASWALAHDGRFIAGIAENGIAYLAGVATGLMGLDFWHSELGVPAWEAAEELTRSSPLFTVAAIRAPLLLIHAEEDTVVPIAQSEAMYIALSCLGRDVRFHRVPGEQHLVNVLGAPSRRLERLRVFDEFLEEHLLGSVAGNRDFTDEKSPRENGDA